MKTRMKFNFFSGYVFKILCWIQVHYLKRGELDSSLVSISYPLLRKLDVIFASRGLAYLINYIKELRKHYHGYLSGTKVEPKLVRLTKDGIPMAFGPLIPRIRGFETPAMQFLNTILFSTRSLKCGSQPDVTPIEQPPTSVVPSSIGKYTKDF